ncbi:MAG: SRPBCC family protein [Planctomycetota bacterium]
MSNLTKILMLLGIGLFLAMASAYFIGGKKKEFGAETTVKAQPYQLFPYVSDPNLKKQWMSCLVEQQLVEETIGEDSHLISVFNLEGQEQNFSSHVIRFQKNEFISVKSRADGMTLTSVFILKGKGDDTEIKYRRILKNSGLRRITAAFRDENYQPELEADLAKLAKLVESQVDNSIDDPDRQLDTPDSSSADSANESVPANEVSEPVDSNAESS